MSRLNLPPVAGPFIQSLRSIGYNLESAIADIIDNSISASAKHINIFTEWGNKTPILAVLDDGIGMTPEQSKNAMQLGVTGPRDSRQPNDLGRFGMGLKTASFSQCKKLTLISKTINCESWYGLRWNLDLVEQENSWLVEVIEQTECGEILDQIGFTHSKGTAVIWNSFDRVIDPTAVSGEVDYNRRIMSLFDHLSLTFHRFIKGEDKLKKIILRLNNTPIKAKDPFATNPEKDRQASTLLSNQQVRLESCLVTIKAYLLPHPSTFTHAFAQQVSPNGDHYAGQGIYIYRAGRLIVSGGWHRLAKSSETNKLARVQVDFGNDADSLWHIDVRKSRVDLPALLREQLRRVISQCSTKSSATFTRRAKMPSIDLEPVWQRVFDKPKSQVGYILSRDHVVLTKILRDIDSAESKRALLNLIETSLPVELIKNDLSATNIEIRQEANEVLKKCESLAQDLLRIGFDEETVFRALTSDSNITLSNDQISNMLRNIRG